MQNLALDIRLGGHPTTEGSMDATPRPKQERTLKALGTLILFLVIAVAAFFIPPHIPWVIAAVVAGAFLSYRQWRSQYTVERFSGDCPRCGKDLPVEKGEQIHFPLKLTCFNCHHEPVITPK